jgi:hypothetical protein
MQGIPIIVEVVNLRKPKGEVLVNYRFAIVSYFDQRV